MRTFEAPIGNDFATVGPEEPKTDAVKGIVDTHVAGRRGSMISREDVTAERKRDDNEHQQFGIVLDGLKDEQFTLNKGQPIAADIIAVGLMKRVDISVREGGMRGQSLQKKFGVSILIVRCKPVKRRRNETS